MLNKERIENNPYRILGLYVGSPKSVEVSHLNRIIAFSKVGQVASFDLRGDDLLQPIDRTGELANAAYQTLSLAKDRIENALLWFGDDDKEWGRVLNEAVRALLEGNYTDAINSYETLISEDSLRESFLDSSSHGLMAMSKDQLALMIAELICYCEDDMESFWMSEGEKPSGLIAYILFERVIPGKLEALLQSIEFYRINGIDFYEFIDRFENTLIEIKPLIGKVGDMYGTDSPQYKSIVEELYKKIYARGAFLIKEIGKFTWKQQSHYKLNDGSYKKYLSEMPIGTTRACMDLIARVGGIVDEATHWVRVDEMTKRILYPRIDNYQSTKRVEYVDDDDIIRRSVRSLYIKKGVAIAAWLGFLYWMFYVVQ